MRRSQRWRQIAFPVLAAVDQSNEMIEVSEIAGPDQPAGDVAAPAVALEHTQAHPLRHLGIRRLADPFGN